MGKCGELRIAWEGIFVLETMRNHYKSIVIGLAVFVVGLVATSGGYLQYRFEIYLEFGFVLSVILVLVVVFLITFRTQVVRGAAAVFPIVLLLTAGYNLAAGIGWELRDLPDNSLYTYTRASAKRYRPYIYLEQHYNGWTLLTTREAWEASELLDWRLSEWARLDSVQIEQHGIVLSADDIAALLQYPHVSMEHPRDTVIVAPPDDPPRAGHRDMLVLWDDDDRMIIVPYDILVSLGVVS